MARIDEIRMHIRNAYGLSDEDVNNLIRMVSEIVAAQMPAAPPAPTVSPDVATKEYVQAYVAGAMAAGQASRLHPGRTGASLWWALDTLMLQYDDGGTFEDLRADILQLKDEHTPMGGGRENE
ncbi:MAG: hypothetical protein WBA46_04560 [Thermomicrobiales bacterium]